jgi:DNA-directed RNA polymerase specialized sigma subunit
MIRSEHEYHEAVTRLLAEAARMKEQQSQLKALGLDRDEIKRAMDPVRSFHEQLREEVESYERLKRREFDELRNFEGLGSLLIALRIAQGLSQRDLAERLGVHESQVSRDERNEYRGITVERANRVLEALGAEMISSVTSVGKGVAVSGCEF